MECIIWLHGCDDSTPMKLKLTDKQLEFVNTLEQKSKEASTYGCMPVLEVELIK